MTEQDISTTLRDIADRVGPAVAGIGRGWGSGSGVVVDDGLVVTVAHGPHGHRGRHRHGPPGGRGRGPGGPPHRPGPPGPPPPRPGEPLAVTLAGTAREAEVRGTDPVLGLTVLRADTSGVTPVPFTPATAAPALGDLVVALADPGGRGLRVTHGHVASAIRPVPDGRGLRHDAGIEHTAPLPRGSAGGPLVDAEGRLLGLNAVRPSPGLVLALWTAPGTLDRLRAVAEGNAPRPRTLGVAVAPPHVARRLRRAVGLPDVTGVLVREVAEEGAAARAGILPGDMITEVAGTPVEDAGTIARAVDAATPGAPLALTVVRGAEVRAVRVDLGDGEAS